MSKKKQSKSKESATAAPVIQHVDVEQLPIEVRNHASHPAFRHGTRVFQIYYRPDQLHQLEPEFIPYNNAAGDLTLLEYSVFRKLYGSEATRGCSYWGALSWRFREKAQANARDLFAFIQANPGYDLYYMNPEPHIEGMYENLWVQGSTAHPDFLALTEKLFNAVGMDTQAISAVRHTRVMCAANYFVGSQRFWDAYIGFIDDFLARAEQLAPPELLNTLKHTNADPRDLHSKANYFPFIIERLLTEFIVKHIGQLSFFKIELITKKQRLPASAADLEWLKNTAIENRDPRMIEAWKNYRNLYFKSLYGDMLKG